MFLLFYAVTNGLGALITEFVPRREKPEVRHCLKCHLVFANCFHVCCSNMILQMKMLFGIYVVLFKILKTKALNANQLYKMLGTKPLGL